MFEMLEKFREIPNVIFFFFEIWLTVSVLKKKKNQKKAFLSHLMCLFQ